MCVFGIYVNILFLFVTDWASQEDSGQTRPEHVYDPFEAA